VFSNHIQHRGFRGCSSAPVNSSVIGKDGGVEDAFLIAYLIAKQAWKINKYIRYANLSIIITGSRYQDQILTISSPYVEDVTSSMPPSDIYRYICMYSVGMLRKIMRLKMESFIGDFLLQQHEKVRCFTSYVQSTNDLPDNATTTT